MQLLAFDMPDPTGGEGTFGELACFACREGGPCLILMCRVSQTRSPKMSGPVRGPRPESRDIIIGEM